MADAPVTELYWKDKIRFTVAQAKLSAATGNFAYFHASRAQYVASGIDYYKTLLQGHTVSEKDLGPLRDLNISSTEANETSITGFAEEVKEIQVDPNLSPDDKKLEWKMRILGKIEDAKKTVTDAMDGAGSRAIEVIDALPASAQDPATDFYLEGLNIVMEAFEYLSTKVDQVWNWIAEFIKAVWTALENTWKLVDSFVRECVRRLSGSGLSLQENVIDNVNATDASQVASKGTDALKGNIVNMAALPSSLQLK